MEENVCRSLEAASRHRVARLKTISRKRGPRTRQGGRLSRSDPSLGSFRVSLHELDTPV